MRMMSDDRKYSILAVGPHGWGFGIDVRTAIDNMPVDEDAIECLLHEHGTVEIRFNGSVRWDHGAMPPVSVGAFSRKRGHVRAIPWPEGTPRFRSEK